MPDSVQQASTAVTAAREYITLLSKVSEESITRLSQQMVLIVFSRGIRNADDAVRSHQIDLETGTIEDSMPGLWDHLNSVRRHLKQADHWIYQAQLALKRDEPLESLSEIADEILDCSKGIASISTIILTDMLKKAKEGN